jgi:hypothetical protein
MYPKVTLDHSEIIPSCPAIFLLLALAMVAIHAVGHALRRQT